MRCAQERRQHAVFLHELDARSAFAALQSSCDARGKALTFDARGQEQNSPRSDDAIARLAATSNNITIDFAVSAHSRDDGKSARVCGFASLARRARLGPCRQSYDGGPSHSTSPLRLTSRRIALTA